MQKASARHRALGRSVADLDAREPSLVDTPLPVNSIPVVGPLVSPVVGNGAGGGAQPSSTDPQPAPVSSTVGSGTGGGDGGGSTPAPSDSPTNGGGNIVPPMSPVPGPASPTPVPGIPDGSSPGNPSGTPSSASRGGSTSGSGTQSSSNSGAPGNFLGTSGKQTAPVNVGATTKTSTAVDWSGSPSLSTGFQSSVPSSLGSSPNVVGTAAPSPTATTAAAASSRKQFPGGLIAGIIIVCLLALGALTLLVIRRRSISRRLELRRQWWFGRAGGEFPPLNNRNIFSPVGEASASRLSTRSSFATNFDQGLMFRVDPSPPRLSLVFPDVPPMAEVRERNSVLISTGGAIARRESMNSMLSSGSDPDAQYLTVTGQDSMEPSTPMSVRPFSPSESFAFPKPPGPPSATVDSFFSSRRQETDSSQSPATPLVHLSSPPRVFMADLPPGSATTLPQTSTLTPTLLPSVSASDYNVDPFADPAEPEFADIEIIRRPFAPSLDDELAVHPGDRVRILQVFDDGWTRVEKLAPSEKESHERGLIPVDCLREASQALPAFLAQKRVSTYGPEHFIGTAF
ncbi:hypothetical protein JVU11DRAFT_3698 [Chiua virens]|nr:hypothetical protein JVU11DRAFT_3698 [Chiua virens]